MKRKLVAIVILIGCSGAGTMADAPPQLVVNRARPQQIWTSATRAPIYASVGEERRIDFWDSRDGTLLRTVALPAAVMIPGIGTLPPAVVLSNDGQRAAFGAVDTLSVVSRADGKIHPVPAMFEGIVAPLAFTPDGERVAVNVQPTPDPRTFISANPSIALVALATGVAVAIPGAVTNAAISPDGRFVAALSPARDRLLVYDSKSGAIRSFMDAGGVYGPIVFSPDGRLVISGGDDPSIPPRGNGVFDAGSTDHDLVVKVWDMRRGRLLTQLPWRPVYARVGLDEQAAGAFAFVDATTLAVDVTDTSLYTILAPATLLATSRTPTPHRFHTG